MLTALMLTDNKNWQNNTPAITIKQPLSKATFEHSLRHRQYRVLYNIGWCDHHPVFEGHFLEVLRWKRKPNCLGYMGVMAHLSACKMDWKNYRNIRSDFSCNKLELKV